jgi:hypothetical protein
VGRARIDLARRCSELPHLVLVRRENRHPVTRTFLEIALVVAFAASGFGASGRWDASRAEADAERDFVARHLQFYWHGTRASYPVGVPREHFELARRYPHRDAGIGCSVDDSALRARQKRFAERYNAKMLSLVLQKR